METGKACFENVWINQHIVDSQGYKMSKSKGNVIDPQKLLTLYGGEAIRMWASTEGDLSRQDLKCSEDRIKGEKKTINKILNVAKFVSMFEKPIKKPKLTNLDKLYIDYIEDLTLKCEKKFEEYDFYRPMQDLRNFIWEIFASHYVEIVKARAYNKEGKFSEEESNSAKWALHYILERFLILVYPVLPQISSLILGNKGIDVHSIVFPSVYCGKSDLALVEKICEFNSAVWKAKKDAGISLRENIEGINIPEELKEFEKDLSLTHGLL